MQPNEHELAALTPLDGRYRKAVSDLAQIVSEKGLIAYRIRVEAHWLLHLAGHPQIKPFLTLSPAEIQRLNDFSQSPPSDAGIRIKEIEGTTNHDVKAVEYYLREQLTGLGDERSLAAFLHFACTSEDINNLAYGLMLKESQRYHITPAHDQILGTLANLANENRNMPMMSRTHGQEATPTTLGKEFAVFVSRLSRQSQQLQNLSLQGKMNGAVGNYNAHLSAFPDIDWPAFTKTFVETRLGLEQNPLTTQIENHDSMIEYVDIIRRFNVILLGFCRDIWGYVSLRYLRQIPKADEVGSSTMPHKVNPIDFENAEGNLGIAISLGQHFSEKLPISRWQRDLSDSTVQRAFGLFLGHSLLAYKSVLKGLKKIEPNQNAISQDLSKAWEILAEPIQTIMRKHGITDAYERLKKATRGSVVSRESLHALIKATPELPEEAKNQLLALTPATYTGLAGDLVSQMPNRANISNQQ